MYPRRGGGYYFNVGCSEFIASGRSAFTVCGYRKSSSRKARGCATGRSCRAYLSGPRNRLPGPQETIASYFDDEVANRVGPVWGYDEDRELRNMLRRTAQPGLWFTAGSFAQSRIFSRYLALQIKALEVGLLQ